ncbi:MAG: four helix bundle protein [Spirochaetes bacterium]|nr:four helix bundle protein [Spirochaetota bacterium]
MTYKTVLSKEIITFEDVEAWQKGRELVNAIYKITETKDFKSDSALKDQLRRMSISIMTNIAVGFEREKYNEFIKFLSVAKGFIGELKTCLYISLDVGNINKDDFHEVFKKALETDILIIKMIDCLNNKKRAAYNDRRRSYKRKKD